MGVRVSAVGVVDAREVTVRPGQHIRLRQMQFSPEGVLELEFESRIAPNGVGQVIQTTLPRISKGHGPIGVQRVFDNLSQVAIDPANTGLPGCANLPFIAQSELILILTLEVVRLHGVNYQN